MGNRVRIVARRESKEVHEDGMRGNSVINKVNETYSDKKIDYLQSDLEDLENEMPVIRDIPWYEKALNGVGGTLVSLARDNIEGLFFIPNFILDELFGTNNNENMERYFNNLEEDLINTVVTDKQSYYYGIYHTFLSYIL